MKTPKHRRVAATPRDAGEAPRPRPTKVLASDPDPEPAKKPKSGNAATRAAKRETRLRS